MVYLKKPRIWSEFILKRVSDLAKALCRGFNTYTSSYYVKQSLLKSFQELEVTIRVGKNYLTEYMLCNKFR